MKIEINYWEQLDCIRANRVLKIFAASLIWFCAKDCWLIVHHVPEKRRELFRHEDMRVRKSSCAKLVFPFLLGLFLLLRLPQQGEQSGHAIGVCISFNFHKVCFPWFRSLWSSREVVGLCLDQHYAMFHLTNYRLQKNCSCANSHWSLGGEGVLWWSTQNGCREKRGFCRWKVRETPFFKIEKT